MGCIVLCSQPNCLPLLTHCGPSHPLMTWVYPVHTDFVQNDEHHTSHVCYDLQSDEENAFSFEFVGTPCLHFCNPFLYGQMKMKSICGFGTSTGTFNLWVNFSPSPSPELLLHFEARDARKEIFSVLPPGRQLAQKQPFALTKSIAERVIRSKESASPSPMLVPISQQFNNPLPCLLLGPQASWSWSCHLDSVHIGYSRC